MSFLAEFQSPSNTFEIKGSELVLLIAGAVLTLAIIGVFIYVFTRKDDSEKHGRRGE